MTVEGGRKKTKLRVIPGGRNGRVDFSAVTGQCRPPTHEEWAADMADYGMPEYVITLGKSTLPVLPTRRNRNGH